MKRLLLASILAALMLGGCGSKPEFDPSADSADTSLLKPAQGHLAPGVVVYEEDGAKLGRVIKVDPDHVFPSGKRGGVLMDYTNSKDPDAYMDMAYFDHCFVPPTT